MKLLFFIYALARARECPENWKVLGKYCVSISKFGLPRRQAEQSCVNKGATLFMPENEEQFHMLQSLLESDGLRTEFKTIF